MNPIVINLEDVIQACRENFDQIQALQEAHSFGCSYSGPCMLGMPLTEEQRSYLDHDAPQKLGIDSTISELLDNNVVVSDHGEALVSLQAIHDGLTGYDPVPRSLRARILAGLLDHDWSKDLPILSARCISVLVVAHILASRSPA